MLLRFIVSIYQFDEFIKTRYVFALDACRALEAAYGLYNGPNITLTVRNVPTFAK